MMKKQKVIVYVDGFNFYYGLKKNRRWRRYYWLDVVKLFEKFMKTDQELVQVKYFSAKPENIDKALRQNAFFQANRENQKFQLILGKYLRKTIKCYNCGFLIQTYEEKALGVGVKVFVYFPPFHHSNSLSNVSTSRVIDLGRYESRFRQCIMPDTVHLDRTDFDLTIPSKWKAYQND